MAQAPSVIRREAGTSSKRRPARRRPAASHLLVAVAVVLAFVLNLLALQGRGATVMVAVADRPITIGATFAPDMVRMVPVAADFAALPSLLRTEDLPAVTGWVVQRSVADGGLLERSNLARPAASHGLRAMSVPVPLSRAAGGSIVPGDRVDIVAVRDGEAAYVVSSVEVLSVASTGSGFSSVDYHLVIAVTEVEALAMARALASGAVDVIRSTGAGAEEP